MNISLLILIIISIHLLIGVPEAKASWSESRGFDRSRRDDNTIGGYDLRRGPVIYEAYYPSLNDDRQLNSRNDETIDIEDRSSSSAAAAYQVARQLERFAKALETNTDDINQYSESDIRGYRYPPAITDYEREFIKDYTNIILSAVKKEAFKIQTDNNNKLLMPKTINSELSRQQRFVETIKPNYRNNDDNISQMELHRTEKIFQPRPQIINYVFSSKNNKPVKRENTDNVTEERKTTGIASIEVVSQIPTKHKIRHHHGEKIRRSNTSN